MLTPYAGYETQEELDRDYDVENTVPDFMKYALEYEQFSAETREALNCEVGVFYGPTLMETVNIFPQKKGAKAPILIFIHGGFWRSLTADVFDFVAEGPVKTGYAVVNVTYALCPNVTIGEIVRQVRGAITWAVRNADSFGGDPARIYLAGHSAGAHLTAMALLTNWNDEYGLPSDVVKGAIAISGVYDLAPLACCFAQPSLRITGDDILNLSPIRRLQKSPIPLNIIWGNNETPALTAQSRNFAEEWRKMGNIGDSFEFEDNHFSILDGFKTADGALTKMLLTLERK